MDNEPRPAPALKRIQIPTITLGPERISDLFFNGTHTKFDTKASGSIHNSESIANLRDDAMAFAEQLIDRNDPQFETLVQALVGDFFNRL